jgi:hypothetical protein
MCMILEQVKGSIVCMKTFRSTKGDTVDQTILLMKLQESVIGNDIFYMVQALSLNDCSWWVCL